MTLVLDTGGVSALAGQRARVAELRRRGHWPPQIPAVVLTEALTGDHRHDFHTNHLIALSQVRDVAEPLTRQAALLRTRTGRAAKISAVDAIVAAHATHVTNAIILTSDPTDLTDLVAENPQHITVARA